ncbi:MAG: hypothetical protein HZA90_19010 [Verrucomicrobia bacterium]|nr:hypothetical protein [Verrucomicrobiota bacterium]
MARTVRVSGPGLVAHNNGEGATLNVLANRRGRLFSVVATNATDATLYLQAFDVANGAAAGAVPRVSVPVPAGENASLDWAGGRPFALGICVAFSTQVLSYQAASGNTLIDAGYETD